ncbi:M23 family metallopeptidase [Fulvivirga sp. RKSG066]|uniref:M23 family metallopeptidase n=1 Tax=Fulvivirga aurantia TaxID=2529383 RepID=UPI0012BC8118|nr:M23 family metallopeptidase [Fulvivirga aurantia]MTI22439.1 M23 family metallopeptidase [Fulvivirga aurantia]
MAKIRYYYNTETCKYEPIKATGKAVFLNILGFLSVSLILALGLIYVYRSNFTPIKESRLLAENHDLKVEWEILKEKLENAYGSAGELQYKDDNIYRVILDADPIPSTVREGGVGGHDKYEDLMSLEENQLVIDAYKGLDNLKKKLYIQSKSYDEISSLLTEKEKMWAARPAIQPINNTELKRIAGGFNPKRFHPILKKIHPHEGIDFSADTGTPIYATGDGIVTARYLSTSYGNVVFINHGYGYQTVYAHMSKFNIKRGETVKRGQIIGYVGNTGRSQGPHLHYEVLYNYKAINPINFFQRDLDNEEYEKLIKISENAKIILD